MAVAAGSNGSGGSGGGRQMEPSPFSGLRLRNPFVFKVGQVMTGAGVGCGVGIGIGRPLQLGALGQFVPIGDRMLGKSGHYVQQLVKRLGIKKLDAGVGCGVGVGHGFALVGIALKPGVTEEVWQFVQNGLAGLASRLSPQFGALTLAENKVGGNSSIAVPPIDTSASTGLSRMLTSYPPTTATGLQLPGMMPTTQSQHNRHENEVERLKLEKEILQTLLRQQRQIEALREELQALQEVQSDGKSEPSFSSTVASRRHSQIQKEHLNQCFECRRRKRQRM